MGEQPYWMVVGVLAVWRVTHFVHAEDGPGNVVAGFRRRAGDGFWGRLLGCFYCLSTWVSAPFAVVLSRSAVETIIMWLALSGGAILLHRVTEREATVLANYVEDREE